MGKIPLERTIGDTFRFTFSNFLSILGVVWLPTLIFGAAIAATFLWIWPDIRAIDWNALRDDIHANNPIGVRILMKIFIAMLPLQVLAILMRAMIAVGVQRKALGIHEGPVFVFFSLGGVVWRLIGGLLFGAILTLAMAGLLVVAVGVVHALTLRLDRVPAALIDFAAIVAACCWYFYFAVRLNFFIPPAVVAEGGFGLGRSWQLGGGNFWRIVGVFLIAVFAPLLALSMVNYFVAAISLMGVILQLKDYADTHANPAPQEVISIVVAQLRMVWPFLAVYAIAVSVFVVGLTNSVSAMAYKNIQPAEPAE